MKSKTMFIIHHFFRSIWANFLIKLPYDIFYLFKYILTIKAKIAYGYHKQLYLRAIKNDYLSINKWFKNIYVYKWDGFNWVKKIKIEWLKKILKGLRGLLDHNNSFLEFFINFGDCDDVSFYSYKALKKAGYKAIKIGIKGKSFSSWHYDCIFILKDKTILFNFGDNLISLKIGIEGINECVEMLSEIWLTKDRKQFFEKPVWWKCYPVLEWVMGKLPLAIIILVIVLKIL